MTLAARVTPIRQLTLLLLQEKETASQARNHGKQTADLDSVLNAPGLMHAYAKNELYSCLTRMLITMESGSNTTDNQNRLLLLLLPMLLAGESQCLCAQFCMTTE